MAKLTRFKDSVLDPQTEWTRRKLQILLSTAVVVVLLLVGGMWSLVRLQGDPTSDPTTDMAARGITVHESGEDRLAEQPLPAASLELAQPGTLSTGQTGTLRIPAPTSMGPANVPTGFPQTPAGALAQLIAIDQTALNSASVKNAQLVIDHWAAPGGPTPQNWSAVQGIATLLTAADQPANGSGGLMLTVEASMGFIKGSLSDDFVVPCVDLVISASNDGYTQRVAAGDCQRMIWETNRWIIGPGDEPATAPSLWPGTQESFDAGYLWLEVAP